MRSSLEPIPVIQNLLDELHVRCRWGCGWTGRQDAMNAHMENCPVQELAATREKLSDKSLELEALRAEKNRVIEDLIFEKDLLAAGLVEKNLAIQVLQTQLNMSKIIEDDVVQKDLRIVELQRELEIAKACAQARAEMTLAELHEKRAAEELQRAREDVEVARCNRRAAEKRARDSRTSSASSSTSLEPSPSRHRRRRLGQ